MPLFEDVACELCGSRDARVRFESRVPDISPEHFKAATDCYGDYGRIVTCRSCGLTYTNPRISDDQLLASYASNEDSEYAGESNSRSINAYLSLNTIQQHVPSGRLLDVGCNAGYFLNAARLAFEPSGIEPGRHAVVFAEKQLGLKVYCGTLQDAPLTENSFDVVTLIDVIEHFAHPRAALRRIQALLKPGGLLYIVTPNIGSLAARLMRSRWWGLRPAHLYYFSPDSLKHLLNLEGFDVIETRPYGRAFTCAYWLSRLRHYSSPLVGLLRWTIRRLGIAKKVTYLNTMDSMECCARKRIA